MTGKLHWASLGLFVLLGHVGLLMYSAAWHSPTTDEPAHLAAGLSMWRTGSFSDYSVNPPLVRMVASFPVLFMEHGTDNTSRAPGAFARSEFSVGNDFVRMNGERTLWLLTVARWACIPFSLLGAWTCRVWARDVFGPPAGFVALCLWCLSPMILGHGAVVTADVPCAAMFVTTCYAFYIWLSLPTWGAAFTVGILLGTALLTKFTCLLAIPVMVFVWLVSIYPCFRVACMAKNVWQSQTSGEQGNRCKAASGFKHSPGSGVRRQLLQLTVTFLTAIAVVNIGYGFEGSGRRLDSYQFRSRLFTGVPHRTGPLIIDDPATVAASRFGNRFCGSVLGALHIPLPENYLGGIDIQRRDFETPVRSYLFGEWKNGGWWYYYLAGFLVKLPIGTLLLIALASFCFLRTGVRAGAVVELLIGVPLVIVMATCSAQTNMSHHLRYAMPVLPFLFIWISRSVCDWCVQAQCLRVFACTAVVGMSMASLFVFPHSLAFFNVFAGGPNNGQMFLLDSNFDWGQNRIYLREWMEDHPEARPMSFESPLGYDHQLIGLKCIKAPHSPTPGWHAIRASQLMTDRSNVAPYNEHWLRDFTPVARIGYTIWVFHILPEQLQSDSRAEIP